MKNCKTIQLLASLLLLTVVLGSSNSCRPKPSEIPYFVVVLCDVSTSISSNAEDDMKGYIQMIGNLKENCTKLIRTYPPNSVINFYTISENASALPFEVVELEQLLQNTQREQMQKLVDKEENIRKKLDSLTRDHENYTCILTSLQNAYNVIEKHSKGTNGQKFKNEVIVFSDLCEQCKNSPAGVINMKKQTVSLSNDEFNRLNSLTTKVNFSQYDITLRLFMTTTKMLSAEEKILDSTWRIILTNYGYKCDNKAQVLWETQPNFVIREEYKSN